MKKLLSCCLAFMLVLSASFIFSGCKKGKTKIGFDSGLYSCELVENSFKLNEELTETEVEEYLDYNSDFDVTYNTIDEYADSLVGEISKTYVILNDYNVKIFYYEATEDVWQDTCLTFEDYTFKKNKLSFNFPAGFNFNITQNSDRSLTLSIVESYNFAEIDEDEIIKEIYSVNVDLTLSTELNPITLPTPETHFYQNKVVNSKYKLTGISNFDIYYAENAEMFAFFDIESAEEYADYIKNECGGTIVLFNDNTMYYEDNIDTTSLYTDSMLSALGINLDMTVRIGYIYSYEQVEGGTYKAIYSDISEQFTFEILNDGANLDVNIDDWLSESIYTLNFTKVVEN